jgi:hypothetical protein
MAFEIVVLPLLLHSLIHSWAVFGASNEPASKENTPLLDTSQSPVQDSDSRSLQSITASYIVTMFTCTWIAIHPNTPSPLDSSLRCALRSVGIMLVGILVPEYIFVWAIRQSAVTSIVGLH